MSFEANDISNTWLRGGPSFRKPIGFGGFFRLNSDSRRKVRFFFEADGGRAYDGVVNGFSAGPSMEFQVTDPLNISAGVNYYRGHREDQYVSTEELNGGNRYIVSDIVQKTLTATVRMNYNITPDLTIQYYGQPFISRGIYSEFKYVNDPLAHKATERMTLFEPNKITYSIDSDDYAIDENLDGISDYEISNPNFDFVQFRSNLVARWEYKPGSEIFLVWSQGSTAFTNELQGNVFESLRENLWDDSLTNTFLLKLTYRFTN